MKEIEIICPYCNNPAEWVENKEIYGKNYGKSYMMWLCRKCDARVGCHQNTKKPLGTMANKELRDWRIKVHDVIDPLWKYGSYSRGGIYAKISTHLGYAYHTGETTIEDCKKILKFAENEFGISVLSQNSNPDTE